MKHFRAWNSSVCLLGLAGWAMAAPAFAQTDTDRNATPSGAVEDIVVTAQKRAESTQRVPIAIEAINSQSLAETRVDNLVAAQKLAPGIVFARAPDEGVQLTFRGLGTPARNKSFEQSVGAFADGIFYGHPSMYIVPFFDVERIEFIKGTQSTLLGKNTSVGAISIISRRPGDTAGGEASVSREFENGGWTVDGALNLAVSDILKVRVAGHFKDNDGWVQNEITGNTTSATRDAAGRIIARFTPGTLDITALYEYADAKRSGSNLQIVTDDGIFNALDGSSREAVLDDRIAQFTSKSPDGDGRNRQKIHLATLIANIPLGESTLTSQTAYAHLRSSTVNPASAPPEEITAAVRAERFSQISQELRFTSPEGRTFDYIVGLYYFHSKELSIDNQYWDVPNLFVAPGVQLLNGHFTNDFRQKLSSYSAFASGTVHLSDAFRIAGGVRYTHEKKNVLFGRSPLGPLTFWNTVANPPFPLTPLKFTDDFVNGNVSLQYDLNPTTMAYASYGRGTKAGGFADSATVSDGNPAVSARIESETAQTYEVGIKSTLMDRKLVLNLAGFYTDVEGYQLTFFDAAAGAFRNLNVPARSYGFEFKALAKVGTGFDVSGSATYANAKRTDIDKPLASAPRWTLNGNASYEREIGDDLLGRLSVNGHYRSSVYTMPDVSSFSRSFGTVDASISVGTQDDRWKVSLSGTNLFNAKGFEFGVDGGIDPRLNAINQNMRYRILNPLRTIELGLAVKF